MKKFYDHHKKNQVKVLHPFSGFFLQLGFVFFRKPYFSGRWAKFFHRFFFFLFFCIFFFLQMFVFEISLYTPKIMFYHFEELKVTLAVPKSRKK